MAIAKVKHIDIFLTNRRKEEILHLIQKLGSVQVIQTKEVPRTKKEPLKDSEDVEETISYLEKFSPKKGLLYRRPEIKEEELNDLIKEFESDPVLKRLKDIRQRLSLIQIELERLHNTKYMLLPWAGLHLALKGVSPTKYTEFITGILNGRQLVVAEKDLEENKLNFYIEIINRKDNLLYLLVVHLKKEKEEIHSILKKYNFTHIILPKDEDPPQVAILKIDREISELKKEKEKLLLNVNALVPQKLKLMILADKLNNENVRSETSLKIYQTQYVSLISGWIKEKDLPKLKRAFSDISDIEVITRDPRPDEDVPVDLENKKLLQPFEFITKIYGMPKYTEVDPTPFLAPFFFLYFGFCVSDVGYGLILTLFSYLVLKKFKMGPQGVRFFKLFLFCGVSTIIIGALTGGWFGNLMDLLADINKVFLPLKEFKDSLIVLDPLKQPTKLLGIALGFGIVQVWFGNIVAAIGNIKNRRYLDIVLDQVSMLIFLFGLTGLGLIFLKVLGDACLSLFKYPAIIGSIMLVLTQGRTEKTIGSKLFYGIYNLYSALSGYLSDVLSYSRLWALGLVTGVMATTINLVSIQFSQIISSSIPFLNKINFIRSIIASLVLIVIFILGHSVSFLMNLLGAFVHPLRLQFVEFFSKFFKTSGSSFKPFKVETKYITIRPAAFLPREIRSISGTESLKSLRDF